MMVLMILKFRMKHLIRMALRGQKKNKVDEILNWDQDEHGGMDADEKTDQAPESQPEATGEVATRISGISAALKSSEGSEFPETVQVNVVLTNGNIHNWVDLRISTKDYNENLTAALRDLEQNGFFVTGIKGATDTGFYLPENILGEGWRGGNRNPPPFETLKR